jgi:hypothetical protein
MPARNGGATDDREELKIVAARVKVFEAGVSGIH